MKTHTIYRANGCEKCFNTGYRGRIGIFEIMHMSDGLKNLILKTFDASQIKQFALQDQMRTLRQSGIDKVLAGTTTIEEVLRVTQQYNRRVDPVECICDGRLIPNAATLGLSVDRPATKLP